MVAAMNSMWLEAGADVRKALSNIVIKFPLSDTRVTRRRLKTRVL